MAPRWLVRSCFAAAVRADLSWCGTVDRPCEAAGGPTGRGHRAPAGGAQHHLRAAFAQPEPLAANGGAEMRGTCSAVFYATNGHAALHGVMDMAD